MFTEDQTADQLEQRAATMERTLAELKKQVAAGGSAASGASGAAGNAALEARLRELLKLMLEDRDECEAIRAQRDALKEENERLKQLVDKGEYRVKHLLRTIAEIEKGSEVAK